MVGETNRIFFLCRELKKRGHEVIVATPAISELAPKARDAGMEVYDEVSFQKGTHPYLVVQDVLRLKKIIEERRIQILHTHGSKDSWAGAVAAYLASPRPLTIRTRHNIFPVARHPLNRLLYRRLTDHLVVISEFILNSYIHDGFMEAQNISLIHSSIDLNRFNPQAITKGIFRKELGISPDEVLVGMVANIVPYKGPEIFLEAAYNILEKRGGVRFFLIGEGDDALEKKLKEEVKQKGLAKKIIFTGIREDIPAVLADLDIFCLPSYEEGLGTAILEAMAMEKPVVATRVGGIPDSVIEGETGFLIDPGDSDNLSQNILSLMDSPQKAKQMGKKGRLRIEQEFTLQTMTEKTEDLYKRLL